MKYLVRYEGEIATKSRPVRGSFVQRLIQNLRQGLSGSGIEAKIIQEGNRLLIDTDQRADMVLGRIFGISSFSPVEGQCASQLGEIIACGIKLYGQRVKGSTYAVRARRCVKHSFTSMDIARRLGAGLNEGATVRLDDPQVEVGVEVHRRETLFYSEKIRGAGGLPLGVQDRALVLISGGFDSAVAAWYMMRRGVPCDFLFCNLAGAAYERSVLAVTRTLVDTWSHGYSPRLHIVDYSELVRQIQQKVTPRFAQVVLKRMFCRTGQKVAARIGASALVTGESVGQVSSQTLSNLQSIDAVATMPVLRPLLCFDKMEIIRLADRIGTGPLSAVIQEYCALVPDKPATRSTPEQVALQERHIDPDIIDHLVELASSRKVKQITERDLVAPYVHTDEITPASVVLDARPRSRYREWHYPDARHCDMPELIDSFKRLDKSKRYVLYCEVGVQTAVLAERMQREGYEAYSYRGGASALRRR